MSNFGEFTLPPKPERPDDEDCCKSDCEMCVFNVYEKKVAEWEKLCKQIKHGEYTKGCVLSSVLSSIKYTPFQLISITHISSDTNLYRFQLLEAVSCSSKSKYSLNLDIQAGQHLIMKNKPNRNDSIITKAYTPISNSEMHHQGCFEVLIKIYPDGCMSNYIKTWVEGEVVYWRGPFGIFCYVRNKYKHVIMCCAGTGIAPMIQIIRSIVEDEEEETFVRLLYSCKRYDEVLLSSEISHFRSFWNFSSCVFITRENPKDVRYGDTVIQGRISEPILRKELIQKPLDRILVLVCGSQSFNEDIKNAVKNIGVLETNVHVF